MTVVLGEMDVARVNLPDYKGFSASPLSDGTHPSGQRRPPILGGGSGSAVYPVNHVHQARNDEGIEEWRTEPGEDKRRIGRMLML